jgi:hypothetical protein
MPAYPVIAALIAVSLCACTTEQMYGSAQGWQRNQCGRILDKAEFDRCMAEADKPYDTYKRDTEAKSAR